MTLIDMARRVEKIITDNSPALLTAIGVTGTLTTAYLTGKATFKAADLIRYESRTEIAEREMPVKEKFELVWKLYIPAAGVGITTCVCIIGANRIGTRRAAAMAAAYSISEKVFVEYKEKIVEKIGENKEREVRDELAQDRVNRSRNGRDVVMIMDGLQVMCHDAFSNQFFKSDMETLRRAQNDINAQILHADYATVSDFYDQVGSDELETTSISGDLGWNTDKMLEIEFSTVMYKEKTPCISIRFATVPIREPWRFC